MLDGVDLTINRGEIMGLIGESGCGKTTLARAILGILPRNASRIDGGDIRFEGRALLDLDEATLAAEIRGRRIAYIPQDPFTAFNPVFTIGTQIADLMRFKSPLLREGGLSARERRRADHARVIDLLRQVQLPDPEGVLRKYPHEVSGGQRQRLMIAMALLPEPRLVIADEPTTALDVTVQAQILKLLKTLARDRGVAVLFTTHDLGTAYEICDRITVMYAGQEAEEAPVASFFDRPSHPYTRKLLDSLPSSENGIRGIPGEIPRLVDPPPGCRFHPRCDRASEVCRSSRPPSTPVAEAHTVRCHHPLGDVT
ncbi:ABC transporter ATP-binding protein [Roseomonas sp. HF4]|uniref:ABC transporter ATP-binding protein n=1 Tax=Roseomonas sp. HF4 TaxID=2562313 RepID=UPI001F108DD2|nr:ABC transporter ATP-binding protein [Roseomonas sp. HF4]